VEATFRVIPTCINYDQLSNLKKKMDSTAALKGDYVGIIYISVEVLIK
jgi:hypothetical protein